MIVDDLSADAKNDQITILTIEVLTPIGSRPLASMVLLHIVRHVVVAVHALTQDTARP